MNIFKRLREEIYVENEESQSNKLQEGEYGELLYGLYEDLEYNILNNED